MWGGIIFGGQIGLLEALISDLSRCRTIMNLGAAL